MVENSPHQETNPSADVIVSLRDVHFAYGDHPIHTGIDITVERGSVVAVMGPSGCGKSTTLGFIGGRIHPQKGEVWVADQQVNTLSTKPLYELRKSMGMMFQHNALLTDLTVFENIAFPLREHTQLPESMIRDLVLMKLQLVGLRGAHDLLPEECSGGMQRRVALARAIAMDPLLVMYDEPFTGLDPISKGIITKLIRQMNDVLNMTSLVVTHDIAEACEIADKIYVLGGGKVLGSGSPEELQQSEQPDIKQFMSGLPDGPVAYHYPASAYHDDLLKGES
ncbi:MAG: ABC transporter ATP-binding protein [Arenicella sp.]